MFQCAEFSRSPRLGRTECKNRLREGRFPLPDKPGLGFELSEDSLRKYPFGGTIGESELARKTGLDRLYEGR